MHEILNSILPRERLFLIKVGFAPGRWMAFFARQFGFSVGGGEHVSQACAKRKNLDCLSVSAEIFDADFFQFQSERSDIVFSAGFVEHFREPRPIITRLANLCALGGFVITPIPSMEELNRRIWETFRPQAAAGHFPLPSQKNRLAREHSALSAALNSLFCMWNLIVKKLSSATGSNPKTGWLTDRIFSIGQNSSSSEERDGR